MVEKLRQTQAGLEETMAVREARERRQRELDEEQHEGEEGQRRVEEQRRIEELRRVEEERHRLKAERVEHEAELRRYGQGEASLHYPVPAIRWGWKYEQTNEEQQRGGRPSFRPPHLEMALNAMAEKWPKARHSKTDKRQIEFVSDLCRKRGDEIGCIYNNDGSVFDKALEQAFRRRIDEWKNPRKRWRLRFCSGA
jgi:hypothetical protein